MNFDEAREQVVSEGAIRIWRVSGGWQIAYRINDGRIEARGLHKIGDKWKLADHLVSSKTYREPDGWHQVYAMHQQAEPIMLKRAQSNPGYYSGLTRQCHTCKKYRPISMFNRDMIGERRLRTWECEKCADERREEMERYQLYEEEHVGDYLHRAAHASRPPVEGEI